MEGHATRSPEAQAIGGIGAKGLHVVDGSAIVNSLEAETIRVDAFSPLKV